MHKNKPATLAAALAFWVATTAQAGYPVSPMPDPTAPPACHDEWRQQQDARLKAADAYLASQQVAYRWFADFPFGLNSGVPFLVLKLLPELAPEQWGGKDNFLEAMGLFRDGRNPGYPIALGIGWTGLARDDAQGAVDYASFTCGGCHIGRVRLEDGGYRYLDGGVNTQFNLAQYRVRVVKTLDKATAGASGPEDKVRRATAAFLAALDRVHAADPHYFYKNYSFAGRRFDAAYEQKQIELFKRDAPAIVGKFMTIAGLELAAYQDLLAKNYRGFEGPMVQGFGGMADATGISTSFAYAARKAQGQPVNPDLELPPSPGLTDFMVVWEQGKRRAHWNADHSQLVDGGGQWNGNIPIPIYRNLAAELTIGLGADTDVRVGAFAEDLLAGLPAPVYPFAVDLALAQKGKALFQDNCAECHKPHNGKVYALGTDLGRARVVSEAIAASARTSFTTLCPTGKEVVLPPEGTQVKPCAKFDGVSLEDKQYLAMLDPKTQDGYNALPLGGVWAQAPYLHNGSVPTLYHLLVPSERPKAFVKSRLDYDQKLGGFAWDAEKPGEGYRFDTGAFPALSNQGHDKDIVDGNKTYRLDWSQDKAGAMALIEYLKTL
ncbi:cytochrome c [Methylomagnum ishizawai]|uniref:cytochrome c n=1 Tax=Methylomagnum ishizawai TaxID=1760988 RepID=UPI001C340CC2|nr:cytochrome c [Methylomagnum ishizawai]BBL76131.1 hypothetical protein MishRS11D_32290 [Methylomagnum ishizawai]